MPTPRYQETRVPDLIQEYLGNLDGEREGPHLPDHYLQQEAEFEGETYDVRSSKLAPPRAWSFRAEGFYCDCHDLGAAPRAYRLLFMPGAERDVPFETKLERIRSWEKSLLFFDSRMREIEGDFSLEKAASILEDFCLPAADIAVFSIGSKHLSDLFEEGGVHSTPHSRQEFVLRWERVVELARTGTFSSLWLEGRK